MRSRGFYGVLVVAVGIGLLATAPASAQTVSLGNGVINVLDGTGSTRFNVGSGNDVNIGGAGTDTDLYSRESNGNISLYFNTSLGQFYIGGPDDEGAIYTRDTTNVVTTQINGFGDLFLGGGAQDGDITVKDTDGTTTNLLFDGATATLTIGANGVAGDDGNLFIRDNDGVTNSLSFIGSGANLELGDSTGADDGDLDLWDGSGVRGIYMRGDQGSIVNKTVGNGLVKAWAQINADGTVRSCYFCSSSTSNTGKIGTGLYEVDFTFDTDISARPAVCSIGHTGLAGSPNGSIGCVARAGDTSSIFVETSNLSGTATDQPFTVVVF